jgi:DNA-directed RNA polymerase specialized sigma24 family protein
VPAPKRDALSQHHLLGLSFKEIADRAGIAETAAKLRSSRGIAQLRAGSWLATVICRAQRRS